MARGQQVMFVLPGVNDNREGGDGQRQAGRQIIRWMSRHRAESYQQGTTGKQTILDHHVLVSLLSLQRHILIESFVLHSQCD